jgi:hypothetical protein
MCRKTLCKRIDEDYESMLKMLTENITAADTICTTADIWTVSQQSYMGITGHWINDNLERQSVALACRRMLGSHTFDKIAEVISDVHSSFGIEVSKVSHTITDGASNFRKAFEMFQEETEEVEFDDIGTIIENEQNAEVQNSDADIVTLPKQQRCCSHTLNLIASSDADRAKSTVSYGRQYNL